MAPHRVLIADDEPVVRGAYRAFLARQPDFELVGEALTGAEAVALYGELRPDLVLMDLQMPVMTGVEAIGRLVDRWPDACVVALTTFSTLDHVVAALRAGASGYLTKDCGGPALLAGMQQALAGEMPLSPQVRVELVGAVAAEPAPKPVGGSTVPSGLPTDEVRVTPREQELLDWLAQGLANAQIARRMHVSEGSVKQYLARVGDKLGATSRTQILVRSIQRGIVDPNALPPMEG